MSDTYDLLLDAAIDHVQTLKKGGTKFLAVSPETLKSLQQPTRPAPGALENAQTKPVSDTLGVGQSRSQHYSINQIAAPEASRTSGSSSQLSATAPAPVFVATQTAPLSAAQRAEKEAAVEALRTRAKACMQCPNLVASRKNVVFGVGDIHSTLMFVGEAPGVDEDRQGEPFVGAAGQLLTKIIIAMGLTRQSVYIANILKCRPDTPGQLTGNRKPTPAEMQICLPFLLEQIDLIKPLIIVALGATAVEGLLGSTQGITRLRGHFQNYRGTPLMPTFHPSCLLHNQAATEKRKVWEDMLQVMEKMGLPISEKQRGYFLR